MRWCAPDVLPVQSRAPVESPVAGKIVVFTGTLGEDDAGRGQGPGRGAGGQGGGVGQRQDRSGDCGPGAGSKAKDAERLGVTIIDEDAWLRLIG
jgi:DNA ligase (NAD+)